MVYQTGIITSRARLYDMTGVANYTASNGIDLGKVGDLVLAKLHRDIQIYRGLASGSAPREASMDGSGILLEFSLHEYDAAAVKILSQNTRPTAANNNWHGPVASANYTLGNLFDSNEILSLMVADELAPDDYPKVYIHRAIIMDVENLVFSRAERSMMTPATFRVIGLHSDTTNGCFLFGDSSKFPSLA